MLVNGVGIGTVLNKGSYSNRIPPDSGVVQRSTSVPILRVWISTYRKKPVVVAAREL